MADISDFSDSATSANDDFDDSLDQEDQIMEEISSPTSNPACHATSVEVFPSHEFAVLMEGLNKVPYTVHPHNLAMCLKAAVSITKHSDRYSQADLDNVRRLIRDAVPSAFEKCLEDSALRRWPQNIQNHIYESTYKLVDLLLVKMQAILMDDPDCLEAEDDLCPLLQALSQAFDVSCEFHRKHKHDPLPDSIEICKGCTVNVERAVSLSDSEEATSSGPDTENCEHHVWLTNLINYFGHAKGFDVFYEALSEMQATPQKRISLTIVDGILQPLVQIARYVTDEALEPIFKGVRRVLEYISTAIDHNIEELSDSGRDRLFMTVSHALERSVRLLERDISDVEADSEVAKVHRKFILQLLSISSFNKHLSAVRETNNMLQRAIMLKPKDNSKSIQVAVEWLRKNDIVQRLLRANLHQKQYVDQVQKVLKTLTVEGGLQEEHLDLLWNVTGKADTFEVVKNNVYAMLGDLAMGFSPQQLDILFQKFEQCKAWPAADSMKIIELMRRFAKSDERAVMADRVLRLLWNMVMEPNAPVEVLKSGALQEVVHLYDAVGQADYVHDYSLRCVEMIKSDDNVVAALHVLKELVSALSNDNPKQSPSSRMQVMDTLEQQFHIVELVLKNLESLMERKREEVAAATGLPATNPPDSDSTCHEAAVKDYTEFLLYIGMSLSQSCQWNELQRIWRELVEKPAVPSDRESGINWFRDALRKPLITNDTAGRVLRELMTSLPPECLSANAYTAFLEYFQHVARNESKMQTSDSPSSPSLRIVDLNLDGIEYMWQLTVDAVPQIACFAQQHLVSVHLQLDDPLAKEAASVRTLFLKKCTSRLFEAQQMLSRRSGASGDAPDSQEVATAIRHVDNSLRLLQEMILSCQGRTMPHIPMHAASFQGPTMKLEVNAANKGSQRFPVVVHRNSYVGALRRLIAHKLNYNPENVRLLFAGHELCDDAALLREVSGMSDYTHVVATHSPVCNNFSVLTSEAAALNEMASPARLLQQMEIYEPLLHLADCGATAAVRYNAAKLLDMLPTYGKALEQIRSALTAEEPTGQLYRVLMAGSGPARLLYNIQVLSSLLYPIDMMYNHAAAGELASREPSPSPQVAAVPAFVSAAQLREKYMSSAGIGVMLQAVNETQRETKDVELLRSLHSIVQLLLSRLFAHLPPAVPSVPSLATSPSAPPAAQVSTECSEPSASDVLDSMTSPSPSSHRAPEFSVVSAMLAYLVQLAWDAGRGWEDNRTRSHAELDTSGSTNSCNVKGNAEDADAQLVIDAVRSISKLVEMQPSQVEVIMKDQDVSRMIIYNLLNRKYAFVRSTMQQMLHQLTSNVSARAWLLNLLSSNLELADRFPRQCLEYYTTLLNVIVSIQQTSEHDQAERLLFTLVSSLDPSVVPEEGDYRLEGKLNVIVGLSRVLDIGVADSCKLTHRLLKEFLFPEAWYLVQSDGDCIEPQRLERAMHAPCNTRGCRQAALTLLSELMGLHQSVLREGVELLLKLHFDADEGLPDWEHVPVQSIRPPDRFVGLKNAGATCYMNAVFQQLYMQPSIRHMLLSAKEDPSSERQDSLFYQLQVMFGHLSLTNSDFYIPRGFWRAFKDYDGEPINLREHQDAYEFFTRLQDAVDCHMRSRKEQPAIKTVMGGKFAQQIICPSVKYRSEKEEEFYQISLDVRGKRNLQESLDFYVQGELMEGDNQYYCEEVGKKVDAVKRNCIKELPHTLVIHLKRFEFDYETMTRWKIRDRFEFPLLIDMFPYTVEGLEQREGDDSVSKDVSSSSSGAEGGPGAKRRSHNYELKGIVVHSGTAFAGHYYSYIKTRPSSSSGQGTWYCFDDHNVEAWDINNLERDSFGGRSCMDFYDTNVQKNVKQEYDRPNSAYMLFYERCDEPEPVELDADSCPCTSTAALMNCSPAVEARKSCCSTQTDGTAACADSMQQDCATVPESDIVDTSMCCPSEVEGVSLDNRKVEQPVPYHMPRTIYNSIMTENLRVIHELHLLDRDYFALIRKLVEANSELCSRKVRRRESSSAASGGESSDGRNPGMGKRRDENDRVGKQTMRLALSFLFKTYLRSHSNLRDDMAVWQTAMVNLMEASPAATRYLLDTLVDTNVQWCPRFLLKCPIEDVRIFVADLISAALRTAVAKDDGTVDPSRDTRCGAAERVDHMIDVLMTYLLDLNRYGKNALYSEVAKVLYEYARIGPAQRRHLCPKPGQLIKSLVDITVDIHRCLTKVDAAMSELVNIAKLASMLIRRLNLAPYFAEADAAENPFRLQDESPITVHESVSKHVYNQKFVAAILSEFVLPEPEVVELVQFLQWEGAQISVLFLNSIAESLWKFSVHDLHCVIEMSGCMTQILTIRDRFLVPRLQWILKGQQAQNAYHRMSLFEIALHHECTAPRRLQLMRLVVQLHETCPDQLLEAMGRENSETWKLLCSWLSDTIDKQANNTQHNNSQTYASYVQLLKQAQDMLP